MAFNTRLHRIARNTAKLNQPEIVRQVLDNPGLQAQMIDLMTQGQMYERGVDANGQSLGQYAPITITFYKPLAAAEGRDGRTDHITLKDTGDFYRSFRLKTTADGLVVSADTRKPTVDLQTVYPDLLGLTDESIKEIKPEVQESLVEETRREIFS